MVKIIPFKAIRPASDKVHLVASRSYVSYSHQALHRKLSENPYTFIHIINPEFGAIVKTKPNTRARFENVKKRFDEFLQENILFQDNVPAYYIYRQTTPSAQFTGLIAGVSIDHYFNKEIKVHEHTLTNRELMFRDYLDICNFNAEPVLLTYEDCANTGNLMQQLIKSTRPVYDFSTTDRSRHELWPVTDSELQERITRQFATVESLYIADGHHRTASSARLGQLRRQQHSEFSGKEAFNYILSFLIPKSQLRVLQFNRIIKNLNGLSETEFLQKLEKEFVVTPQPTPVIPVRRHQFGLRLGPSWYQLDLRQKPTSDSPLQQLDAWLLSELVLGPVLKITDLKTDSNIGFFPGISGLDVYERQVDQKRIAAIFTLYPADVDQIFEVSDAEEVMPPKSTYIEPKLRSGLTIMSLE